MASTAELRSENPDSFRFDRRTVYVLGASRSGQAIARHCLRRGDRVLLSDNDPNGALESETASLAGLLSFSRGRHEAAFISAADEIVLSPGVPMDCQIVDYARRLGKPVQTTVEFVASESSANLIVVTGTSGKTTTLDVLRKLIDDSDAGAGVVLTDRRDGIGIACALEHSAARTVVAELSVSELADVRRLNAKLLVVTSLDEKNNHDEFEDFSDYLEAKLGWLSSLESKLSILAGPNEAKIIRKHFEAYGRMNLQFDFEMVPEGIGPTLALAERVRRVMAEMGLEDLASPRSILDAIRATLLERCEAIEGFAMPILNVGVCKNADSLAWTADAICSEPRIITARPLGSQSSNAHGNVIDLNQNPVEIEEAIEIWARRAHPGERGTVVIDELTRKKLFADRSTEAKLAGPS